MWAIRTKDGVCRRAFHAISKLFGWEYVETIAERQWIAVQYFVF